MEFFIVEQNSMNKQLKKLSKQIYKNYFKENDQRLYVGTDIIFSGIQDDLCDVYIVDYKNDKRLIYLFSLCTLSYAENKDELSKLSNSPKFIQDKDYRQITLKKFGNITKKDIEESIKYFTWDILGMMIFNIHVYLDYENLEKRDED